VKHFWKVIFGLLMAAGLYATFVRVTQGLGASTHLSDEFPWGLWIGFDILVGVGLAAGGFVIAATVHIFHIKRYEEIARPTILTAFWVISSSFSRFSSTWAGRTESGTRSSCETRTR